MRSPSPLKFATELTKKSAAARQKHSSMAPYHYFYELYKQKLHYHSAIKVGGPNARTSPGKKQLIMLPVESQNTEESNTLTFMDKLETTERMASDKDNRNNIISQGGGAVYVNVND